MHASQIYIYALVQGITELFPISSVGHAVILPYLFHWTHISGSKVFLPFIVMLHLGTALALLIYFWRDWVDLISSLWLKKPRERRILGLIVVATIPAAIVGKLLQHKFEELFPNALSASLFLIVNGFVLFLADRLRRRRTTKEVPQISYVQSFFIGLVQAFALIPGFSRSGITMTAGLGTGLSYEESARFSFLLATPIIAGAGILEVPKILKSHSTQMLHLGLVGGLLAGIVAFLSTAFLMRYFRTHEVKALRPFAWYCIGVGAIVAVMASFNLYF
ncbi:MAG: undecaprenyl-diphosphate phosphatase [Alicyclobacillaceae bacterium]|jgi:undecaprenyl-diphosphatase|uniref:undecaprenyl-diphosphate phosphatase n=1 Tax=Alicyclobacillus sp. SP_1 TaxID=2942475 RepID=UPI0021581BFF|nr:undecaprenyl-diphosphate phosphatase [Alicyclobacillus sp. SP_1]MCY0887679.1 undecaprenyl-diphosphate phosphatase [Alicyclobacillaceae bacterium]MCY0896789.1 undecaprenyl-diphosphate phosphatase [Alicyclobacillaceae bacterium]